MATYTPSITFTNTDSVFNHVQGVLNPNVLSDIIFVPSKTYFSNLEKKWTSDIGLNSHIRVIIAAF